MKPKTLLQWFLKVFRPKRINMDPNTQFLAVQSALRKNIEANQKISDILYGRTQGDIKEASQAARLAHREWEQAKAQLSL